MIFLRLSADVSARLLARGRVLWKAEIAILCRDFAELPNNFEEVPFVLPGKDPGRRTVAVRIWSVVQFRGLVEPGGVMVSPGGVGGCASAASGGTGDVGAGGAASGVADTAGDAGAGLTAAPGVTGRPGGTAQSGPAGKQSLRPSCRPLRTEETRFESRVEASWKVSRSAWANVFRNGEFGRLSIVIPPMVLGGLSGQRSHAGARGSADHRTLHSPAKQGSKNRASCGADGSALTRPDPAGPMVPVVIAFSVLVARTAIVLASASALAHAGVVAVVNRPFR